ncbi:hypothetical protein LPLAFNJD_LOCUS2349 [Methylorubrum aminovorans]
MHLQAQQPDRSLAAAISATAARFETVFDRAKPPPDVPEGRISFGALGDGNSSSDDKIAYAIAFARAGGWLHKLVEQYVTGGEAAGDAAAVLDEARRQNVIEEGSTLHAIANARRGWDAAGIELQHFSRAVRQVCRIDVDGVAKGTGFLVRADIVMTSYHVVRSLAEVAVDAAGTLRVEQRPDTAKRLRIVFDDIDVLQNGYRARLPGFAVPAAERWLARASPCHELELLGRLPNDYDELASWLDYALIQLDTVARVGIPPIAFQAERRIRPGDPILILQHPGGRALSVDRASVTGFKGQWRFEHDVNAAGGSSGSPCLDKDFGAVGIHQAGSTLCEVAGWNRAVPLTTMPSVIGGLPPPRANLAPMSDLTEGRPGHPVLGRLETQNWVRQQLDGGDRPILVLSAPRGDGKSFTYDILRSLLPRTQHDVVSLLAGADIQAGTPEAFGALLLRRLAYKARALPAFEANTERPNWLKLAFLPALLRALEEGRSAVTPGKGVWIVVDGLDEAALDPDTEIGNFLLGFYAAARGTGWLRFALLGFDGGLPGDLRDLALRQDIHRPTENDLKAYFQAKLPPSVLDRDLVLDMALFAAQDGIGDLPRDKQLAELQRKVVTIARFWTTRAGP